MVLVGEVQKRMKGKCVHKSKDPPKWSRNTCWVKTLLGLFAELWLWGSTAGGAFWACAVWSGCPAADLWPRGIRTRPCDSALPTWSPFLCQRQRWEWWWKHQKCPKQHSMDFFTLCVAFCQAGHHFTRAWPWCVMGYRAMKWRWELCAFLRDIEMPNTLTIRRSLTHSGGKIMPKYKEMYSTFVCCMVFWT